MNASFVRSNVVRQAKPLQPQASALLSPSPPSSQPATLARSVPVSSPLPLVTFPSPPPVPSTSLPGTRAWLHGLSFLSTGLVDLDLVLGGGYLLHSLVALSSSSPHTAAFTHTFAAEALYHSHRLITVSSSPSASALLALPSASRYVPSSSPSPGDGLKIAWRYQSAASSPPKRGVSLSQSYDLRRLSHLAPSALSAHQHLHARTPQLYRTLYTDLCHALAQPTATPTVTRIVIHALGDVDWGYRDADEVSGGWSHAAEAGKGCRDDSIDR